MPRERESSYLPLRLLIEDAGDLGCLGHIPALPGLCFRAERASELEEAAPDRIAEYVRWLSAEDLGDLTPGTTELIQWLQAGASSDVRVVVAERLAGAPVWESGNAAVLFDHDLQPLSDGAVAAHLCFVGRILDRMRALVDPLSLEQRARRPAPDRRSIDETLEHVGNCIWWYCSRIDDDLPEPDEPPDEDQLDRIDRLSEAAQVFLLGIPPVLRADIHVPTRFPTADPDERWTHTKVCRRQAEHVWTHLRGLASIAEIAGRPSGDSQPRNSI